MTLDPPREGAIAPVEDPSTPAGDGGHGAPILVTGGHRSGTGWVGQIIAASPTPVGYIWEPFSVRHRPGTCAVRFPLWFTYVCDENADQYRPAIERTLRFDYAVGAELASLRSPKDAGRMARDWWRFAQFRRRRAIPLFKDPIAVFSAEWLAAAFAMRVVLLVRHPAAFIGSLKRLHWTHPFDHFVRQPLLMRDHLAPYADELRHYATREQDIVDQGILLWLVIHDVMDTFARRHPEWVLVRQEDLARRPHEEFPRVFAGLRMPYDGAVVRLIDETTSASNPTEANRLDSVRRNSAEHATSWKRHLTADEIDRIRTRTAPVADRFYGDDDW